MHSEHETPEPVDTSKPYATDDVEYPTLGKAAILLIIFSIFSFVLAGGAYWLFVVHATQTAPPAHVIETTPIAPDPNVPILQKEPETDIRKFRADEYDAEHSYAHWKDGDGKESLRIPLDRAMDIVKQSGLPKAAPEPPSNGNAPPPTGAASAARQ